MKLPRHYKYHAIYKAQPVMLSVSIQGLLTNRRAIRLPVRVRHQRGAENIENTVRILRVQATCSTMFRRYSPHLAQESRSGVASGNLLKHTWPRSPSD